MRKKVALAMLLVCVLSFAGLASAAGAHGLIEYRYWVASGITEVAPICDLGVPCPAVAVASSGGDTAAITGEGTLRVREKDGKPRSVTGGGSYLLRATGGEVLDVGSWHAKKLQSFTDFGPDTVTPLPPSWRSGLARILVHLVSDDGARRAAILDVGCILPGNPEGPDFEGIKLRILGGQTFDMTNPGASLYKERE